MSDPVNEFDPRHPHERQAGLPPIFDEEGRCLRCAWEYHTEYIARLEAELAAARAENERLEGAELEMEDVRHDFALEAFTAPDARWYTILDSLRARIRDAVAERDAALGDVAELVKALRFVLDDPHANYVLGWGERTRALLARLDTQREEGETR